MTPLQAQPRTRAPNGSIVQARFPCRPSLIVEGSEALLRLGARALAGDDPCRVPLRRAVAEAANLANDRLRRPDGRRAGGEDVGDPRVHSKVERRLALDHLV